ncbi:MAG TPA: cell division FtsA domain-containing protein [bacterium]|nr:cell division FtsA domain-containing protein [bacterium]
MNSPVQQENEVVIYVGTEKLIALEGSLEGREPRILRYAVLEDREGFDRGFVKSLDRAAASFEAVLKKLYEGAEVPEEPGVHVVLNNPKLQTYSFSSSQYFQGFHRAVSNQEVRSVVRQTRSIATLPLSEFVLQAIPESFLVDDLEGVRNPLGLEARRLGVTLKIFTMNFEDFKNISRAFEIAEINVKGYFPEVLAASSAVLTDPEKEEGALLLDLTEDSVHLALWKGGLLSATRVLDCGGRRLSSDIASKWKIELGDARKVKDQYGSFEIENNFKDEIIPLVERGDRGAYSIHRQEFQENFLEFGRAWLAEMLARADSFAEEKKILHPHYVFTGDGVLMNGFLEFLQAKFSKSARIGLPRRMELPAGLSTNPSFSAAVGLYRWLADSREDRENLLAPRGFIEKTMVSAKDWFSAYF